MRQLVDAAGLQSRVAIVASDVLGSLPLHAAWRPDSHAPTGRRYAIDSLVTSFVPNARALTRASEMAARAEADSVLCVEGSTGGDPLPHVDPEIRTMMAAFPRRCRLDQRSATRSRVLELLPDYAVLHFACHAMAEPMEPMKSGFALAGQDRLSVADLLGRRLEHARLALLSACESAVAGDRLPDEIIGLPSALIEAAVPGVVGTLWSIGDLSAMLVVRRFCELWVGDGMAPVEALRQAQLWLRDTTNGEKRQRFPDIADLAGPAAEPARQFWDDARSFAHPDAWAAFAYFGT